MSVRLIALAAALVPTMALADWNPLSGAEITAALTDRTLVYEDGAKQEFHADGGTVYVKDSPSRGHWAVRAEEYCSVWPPSDRWDSYGLEGEGEAMRFVAKDGSFTAGTYAAP